MAVNKDNLSGLTWPLRLFFVATLAGSFIAYFGGEMPTKPMPNVGFWLLIAAIASAVILFFPKLLLYVRAPDVERASTDLKAATADVSNLSENFKNLADGYKQLSDQMKVIANAAAAPQSIDNRLAALETASATASSRIDAIKAKTDKLP